MNQLPRPLPSPLARSRNVIAVLGPTNTGKTHYAIERMLAYGSGIIGLPLRLLAREVYQKIVDRIGPKSVALVTGEEKIKPENPRYWVCTVEAMPRDLTVDFVAVDEIQIAADLERGHTFTDRILHHRGLHETLLLGAGTMRNIVHQLLPGAQIVTRPRLSQLTYSGEKKITRLPPRSAAVAFSADEVYGIAELIRRYRGGAAVVLGALSPRTRNAQVALYQSGDVDFLVATDAIGMGLNLDVEHVAFASDRKFDGFQFRHLTPAEMGQIAGRAGRHLKDGTFGVTARVDPLDAEMAHRLETHEFDPVKVLQWRNPSLDFRSVAALQASLSLAPNEPGLARAPTAEDVEVLDIAARDAEIKDLATTPEAVSRLWEAAQVPDYRKVSPASHAELCMDVFRFLERRGTLPDDWFARQVKQSDRIDGDIDTLSVRIAHMRTWTFIANRPDWLDDPEHWRETTRALEDKLSDALHERLTQRFVDRRTSVLMRRLRENAVMEAEINEAGDVSIEGQPVGRLQGFQFTPDATAEAEHGKALRAAATKALTTAIQNRAERVAEAGNEAFVLASNGGIRWMGEEIARLIAGETELEPRVRLLADELLVPPQRDWVQARLEVWVRHHVGTLLKPLFDLRTGTGLEGIARGIAFRLVEDLGVLERSKVADDVKGLDQAARAALRGLGVRFGAYHLFVPATMKPRPRELAAQLWALKHGGLSPEALQELPQLANAGRTSIPVNKDLPRQLYRVVGYKVLGERAVRVDILERLADLIRPLIAFRPGVTPGAPPRGVAEGDGFTVTVEMTSLVGCSGEDFASILRGLGYRSETKLLSEVEAVLAEARAKAEAAQATAAASAMAAVEGAPPAEPDVPGDTSTGEAAAPQAEAPDAASVDEAPAEADAAAAADPQPEAPAETAEAAISEAMVAEAVAEAVVAVEAIGAVEAASVEAAPADATDVAPTEDTTAVETVEVAAAADAEPAEPAEPVPPATIEVWRPQRFERRDHQQRGGDRRGPRRGPPPTADGQAPGQPQQRRFPRPERPEMGGGGGGAPGGGDRRGPRPDRPDRPRWQPQGAPAGDASGAAAPAAPGADGPRPDRPARERPNRSERFKFDYKPGGGGGGDAGKRPEGDRPRGPRPDGERPRGPRPDRDRDRDRDRAPRVFSSEEKSKKGPDPDSPFAKLAALKAQMESDKKQ